MIQPKTSIGKKGGVKGEAAECGNGKVYALSAEDGTDLPVPAAIDPRIVRVVGGLAVLWLGAWALCAVERQSRAARALLLRRLSAGRYEKAELRGDEEGAPDPVVPGAVGTTE